MIISDRWKVLVFGHFANGKYGLFRGKKLMERWYLMITEKFLFWTTEMFLFWFFQWWKCGMFLAKKLVQKWYLLGLFELFMIFQHLGNTAFCAVIYSSVNRKWYKKSWNKFKQLKDIDQKYYGSNYYVSVNKYGVKCGRSLRFWENNGWINSIDLYGWFQWYFRYLLCRRYADERQTNRWKQTVSRFQGKLVKMIKDAGSKFDHYSNTLKIRQILLHWGYELTEKDIFINSTN